MSDHTDQHRAASLRRAALLAALAVALAFVVARGDTTAVLALGAAALIGFALVPFTERLARRTGALAHPGGRWGHATSTPRLGGLAVAIPVLVAVALAPGLAHRGAVLSGALLLVLVGVLDDVVGLRVRAKLAAQVAVGVLLAWAGAAPDALTVPLVGTIGLDAFGGTLLVVVWVVAATNAFNLVDGLDGLAASLALFAAVGLAMLGVAPVPSLAVAGAALGFLAFNLPPARVFLGDGGSLLLGFVLAALALELPTATNGALALALFAYPLGDLALAVLRRLVRGKPLFAPDCSHVHHKLVDLLDGPRPALLVILSFAGALLAIGLAHPGLSSVLAWAAGWTFVAAAIVFAGRYRIRRVMGARGALQRIHLVRQYVSRRLLVARTKREVQEDLEQMVDGLGLASLRLNGWTVESRRHAASEPVHTFEILLDTDRAAVCATSASHGDAAVERERQSVAVELVRQADQRLRTLTTRDARDAAKTREFRSASRETTSEESSPSPVGSGRVV